MEDAPKKRKAVRKARVLGVGRDVASSTPWTSMPGRGTGRPPTAGRRGPTWVFELHLAVQTRDVHWTDGIERASLGPEVAGVTTTFSPVAAGTHRGRANVDELIGGYPVEDVVWDPGYSLCQPGTVHLRLAQAGIHRTFQPVTHQRGTKPFSGDALQIDGQLFSPLLSEELRDLPVPPRGAPEEEKLVYEARFNQRA